MIGEGLLEPKPKLLGLRYVTQYVVTPKGKQVADLALQITQLRETAAKINAAQEVDEAIVIESPPEEKTEPKPKTKQPTEEKPKKKGQKAPP